MTKTRLTWSDRVKAGLWGKLPLAPRDKEARAVITYTLADVGCYVDGARGIYAIDRIIELAIEHGMPEPEPCDCFDHPEGDVLPHWNRCEFAHDIECEVEDFMHIRFPVDGAYWGRSEQGDWGLWQDEEAICQLDPQLPHTHGTDRPHLHEASH